MAVQLLPPRLRDGPAIRRVRAAQVVAAAVVVVVVATGAFAAGRVTATSPDAPTAEVAEPQAAGETDTADTGPGPTRTASGVPVGYPRTVEGAVAAASSYLVAIGDKRAFSRPWRERAYQAMADPAAYHALVDEVLPSYERIADELGLDEAAAYDGSVQAVTVPLGYRVDHYTDDRATVTVWAAGWLTRPSGTQLPLRAETSRIELTWVDDDWKLLAVSGSEPLDPPGVAAPPTTETVARMATFTPFDHRPQPQP